MSKRETIAEAAARAATEYATKAAELTDEQLEAERDAAWSMFQTVSRGSSAKAVEVQWARYEAARTELARRRQG